MLTAMNVLEMVDAPVMAARYGVREGFSRDGQFVGREDS
jgi:hypothetical protein